MATEINTIVDTSDPHNDAAEFYSDPKNVQEMLQGLHDTAEYNRLRQEARAVQLTDWQLLTKPVDI